jgi:hypothetical protein
VAGAVLLAALLVPVLVPVPGVDVQPATVIVSTPATRATAGLVGRMPDTVGNRAVTRIVIAA